MASKSTSVDDLSDTDTLIHNMSEGSFEKDRTSLGSGGHNSLGSASGKGSRFGANLLDHFKIILVIAFLTAWLGPEYHRRSLLSMCLDLDCFCSLLNRGGV